LGLGRSAPQQYDSGFCNGIARSDRSGQPQRIISHDSGYSSCNYLLENPQAVFILIEHRSTDPGVEGGTGISGINALRRTLRESILKWVADIPLLYPQKYPLRFEKKSCFFIPTFI